MSIRAHVICRQPLGVVGDPHLLPASPAVDQAGHQRRATSRCAWRGRQVAVGVQSLLVGQVAIPGDVGGDRVGDHDLPLQPGNLDRAGARPVRLLPPRVLTGEPEGITPGVVGMPEDSPESVHRRGAPLQPPGTCLAAHADPHLDVVPGHVAVQGSDRSQLLELVQDQPHDVLDLLVRVQLELVTRARADVPGRG